MYNGVGALSPMNDYGMIMYGSNYSAFGAQKMRSTVWFCCQGSLLQNIGDYSSLIFKDAKAYLREPLYSFPSPLGGAGGAGFGRTTTRFPEEDTVRLKVEQGTGSFWTAVSSTEMESRSIQFVQINGKECRIQTQIQANGQRLIGSGMPTHIEIQFDMKIYGEPLPGYLSPVAVLSGPVVLVKASVRQGSARKCRQKERCVILPTGWILNPVCESINSGNFYNDQELRPFYDLKNGEFYQMYHVRHGELTLNQNEINFSEGWEQADTYRYSSQSGAFCEVTFDGSAICIEGLRGEDAGKAEVYIDGKKVDIIDQFGYTKAQMPRYDQSVVPFRWSVTTT